ncbi:hypothetical protein F4810DRAFT_669318 [Camillea tinctor]|nr:hypothetical protein F4810DRAFT_669318 [Camillea tinctor]
MASKTPIGTQDTPIWARTSVLSNGQIVAKVKAKTELEPRKDPTDPRSRYRDVEDTADNLHALNSLQISRSNVLRGFEVTRPLLHVWECLPEAVQERIGLGGESGWEDGLFPPNRQTFIDNIEPQLRKKTQADGKVIYADLLQQIRSSQYFLWPIEAEEGCWMAVILHLGKENIINPAKAKAPKNPKVPDTIPPDSYNTIINWAVVYPRPEQAARNLRDRVIRRLGRIVRRGDLRLHDDREIRLWVPEQLEDFGSGIRVFNILKEQMLRVTDFFSQETGHQQSFWANHRGWLNVDEIRGEMQVRQVFMIYPIPIIIP